MAAENKLRHSLTHCFLEPNLFQVLILASRKIVENKGGQLPALLGFEIKWVMDSRKQTGLYDVYLD